MSEWQDISTAPKDGTVIDLWVRGSHSEGLRLPNMFWCAGQVFGEWLPMYVWGTDIEDHEVATHWMPIPAPPGKE